MKNTTREEENWSVATNLGGHAATKKNSVQHVNFTAQNEQNT